METFGKAVLSFFLLALAVASRAFAIVILWRWFVIPTFHLSALTWSVAYGLCILIYVLKPDPDKEIPKEQKSFYEKMITLAASGIVAPWLAVGVGWLFKL